MSKQTRTSFVAIGVNIALFVAKYLLALLSGNLPMLAEAYHSLSDVFTSFGLWVALMTKKAGEILDESEKKASKRTTGNISGTILTGILKFLTSLLKRAEHFFAIAIGATLVTVAYFIISRSLDTPAATPTKWRFVCMSVMLAMSLTSYLLSRFEIDVAKETKSQALMADGYHSRMDALGSLAVAVSLIADFCGLNIDIWVALAISALILLNGMTLLWNALSALVAVTRKESATMEYADQDWLMLLITKFLPKLSSYCSGFLFRVFRIDPSRNAAKSIAALRLIAIALISVAAVYAATGFHTVASNEQAVVITFGKAGNPISPGLHYICPWPVSQIKTVDTQTEKILKVGVLQRKSALAILWTNKHYEKSYTFLTGEKSFLDLSAITRYRITNPRDYLFSAVDPETCLKDIVHDSIRQSISHMSFFDAIGSKLPQLENELNRRVTRKLSNINIGIKLVEVILTDIHPPINVASAYEDVISSKIEMQTRINNAHAYANKVIASTKGETATILGDANVFHAKRINSSIGAAAEFKLKYDAMREYRDITIPRLYFETMEKALTNAGKYILVDDKGNAEYWVNTGKGSTSNEYYGEE